MNSKIDEIQEEVDWISAIMCEFDETEEQAEYIDI